MGLDERDFFQGLHTASDASKLILFVSFTTSDYTQNKKIDLQIDATFKIVPRVGGAYQLLIVHVAAFNTVIIWNTY